MKNLLLILFLLPYFTNSQNVEIDSLRKKLEENQIPNESKVNLLHKLSLALADVNPEEAFQINEQHYLLAKKNKNREQVAAALNVKGILSRNKGEFNIAIKNFIESLKIYDSLDLKSSLAMVYNNIGVSHMYNDVYSEAVKYYEKALDLANSEKDTNVIKMTINNLGIIYCYQEEFEKGINYFKQSLRVESKLKNQKGVSECLNNIGAGYFYLQNFDSALYYFESALDIEKELNDQVGIAGSLVNLGELYTHSKNYEKAEKYLLEVLAITQKHNIAAEYQDALFNLSSLYEDKKEYAKALLYQRKFQTVRDSINSIVKSEQIAEMQTKYETEKNQRLLAQKEVELAQTDAKIQKRNVQLISSIGTTFFIFFIGFFIYIKQKNKEKQLNLEVEIQKSETKNKIQNEKLRISRDLHDNIGSQLTFIISTLDNLSYIKEEPKRNEKLSTLSQFTKDTINQLRETIWVIKNESISTEELHAKISEYIEKAKVACPTIQFTISSNSIISRLFNSNDAIQIYRSIQEIINNSIKHSNCSEIHYKFNNNIIELSDNGLGFNKLEISRGNGLIHIEQRIKETGNQIKLNSALGKGTNYLIEFV